MNMDKRIETNNLKINESLYDFINTEVLKGIGISKEFFWEGFSKIIYELSPINRKILDKRKIIQNQINTWHKENKTGDFKLNEYKLFLKKTFRTNNCIKKKIRIELNT